MHENNLPLDERPLFKFILSTDCLKVDETNFGPLKLGDRFERS